MLPPADPVEAASRISQGALGDRWTRPTASWMACERIVAECMDWRLAEMYMEYMGWSDEPSEGWPYSIDLYTDTVAFVCTAHDLCEVVFCVRGNR